MKRTRFFVMALAAMLSVGLCSCEKENNNGGGTEEWVDLGLPSGRLWASCNLGATKPEEYGDYYAWAETEPKEVYFWNTYKYCNCMGNDYLLTKYCSRADCGYNGFTDTLTVLQAIDDAATVKLGNDARIPTKGDWEELIANTTSDWTTVNGVRGRKFTAPNGKSLFLPTAGFRNGTDRGAGGSGSYWSSSLLTDYPYVAWGYYFDDGYVGVHNYNLNGGGRANGLSVRAVR